MGSVTIRYETSDSDAATPVSDVEIRQRSGDACTLSLDGIPNGILLPHVVAHAATRNGVHVLRYPRRLSDLLAAIETPTD